MTPEERGAIVDYHEFEIWRYENDSIDLHCKREDFEVDVETAYMEAMVVARALGEELHETEEICNIKVYENGLVSSTSREKGEIRAWRHFLWMKEQLSTGGYTSSVGLPQPAKWLMTPLWALEYFLCLNALQWQLLTGRVVAVAESTEQEEESVPRSELPAAAAPEHSNVIPFPRKTPTEQ